MTNLEPLADTLRQLRLVPEMRLPVKRWVRMTQTEDDDIAQIAKRLNASRAQTYRALILYALYGRLAAPGMGADDDKSP